jgi:hypothetical protein
VRSGATKRKERGQEGKNVREIASTATGSRDWRIKDNGQGDQQNNVKTTKTSK